jgi:SAM-dependent methyltransferase
VTPYCPLCKTIGSDKPRAPTPYYTCSGCGLWWQSPAPPKLYQHPDEYDLAEMPEGDREANRIVAQWLFDNPLGKKAGAALDIGSKHGVLSAFLAEFGCDAWAIDAEPAKGVVGVTMLRGDFENDPIIGSFDLITCIHSFEHLYQPIDAMRKMRGLLNDDGRVFIRMPDSAVRGIERDFDAHHYSIHPLVHSLSSVAELCAITGAFVIEFTYELLPGQRDLVLSPI